MTAAEKHHSKKSKKSKNAENINEEFQVDDCHLKVCSEARHFCNECRKRILKGELEISRKDYSFECSWTKGPLDTYHHLECFNKRFPYFVSLFKRKKSSIAGFEELTNCDKEKWTKILMETTADGNVPLQPIELMVQLQNKKLFFIKNMLIKKYSVETCTEVLSLNGQFVPKKFNDIMDLLSNTIYYGALEPCQKCQGMVSINSNGTNYKCTFIGEWAVCSFEHEFPARRKMIIPFKLFLYSRLPFGINIGQEPVKLPDTNSTSKTDNLLQDLEFIIVVPRYHGSKVALKRKIEELGGVVREKVSHNTAAIISTEQKLVNYSYSENIAIAKKLKIDAVSGTFLKDIIDSKSVTETSIYNNVISTWSDGDVAKRVIQRFETLKMKVDEDEPEVPKVKLRVKGGGIVDHEVSTYIQNNYHVYKREDENFTVTLGMVDIALKTNLFAKIQILEKDVNLLDDSRWMSDYIILLKSGQIGDKDSTRFKEHTYSNIESCIEKFEKLFESKTGNLWKDRNNFIKKAKLMHPIDEDLYGEDNVIFNNETGCTLAEPIKNLVGFIVDVNSLNQELKGYEIDLKQLPLGKLSERQIQKANKVLTDLLIKIKRNALPFEIESATNQFFTLIPQKIGKKGIQILDTEEKIKKKAELLESLQQLETAYKLYYSNCDPQRNIYDIWYEKLKTEIKIVERTSAEFLMIQKYVDNSHGLTHNQYKLVIRDIFEVSREGEAERFNKFHNRRLLWHGSRSTNFASILINGLQIAPPEVPHTGYMFGKGIYFSDTVSKSANYCKLNRNSDGLVALCEVSLGTMMDHFKAANVVGKLPENYQSVMGRGSIVPSKDDFDYTKDGAMVPYGPRYTEKITTSLLYNEYVVYNPNQVKIKYIVRFQFIFS